MRIYRNKVNLYMGLEEFLEILEDDMLDDIINMVVEMDEDGEECSIQVKMFDLGSEEDEEELTNMLSHFDSDGDLDIDLDESLSSLFNFDKESLEKYDGMLSNLFSTSSHTHEDRKVMRILERFGSIDDFI